MAEVHKHVLITGYYDSAPEQKDVVFVEDWFLRLVEAVDMNVLVPPNVVWCDTIGNEGLTGVVVIDTSHSSIHCWPNYFKFDLYSCKDFQLTTVVELLKEFGTKRVTYTTIDRTFDDHPILESGEINF